jgi:hypothetical protein
VSSEGIEVVDREVEIQTDVSLVNMKRLDAILRLFDGDVSLTELVHMDLPSQRALIQSRIDNLKESHENYENGKIDSYSRRYANVMGGFIPGRGGPERTGKEETKKVNMNMRALINEERNSGE